MLVLNSVPFKAIPFPLLPLFFGLIIYVEQGRSFIWLQNILQNFLCPSIKDADIIHIISVLIKLTVCWQNLMIIVQWVKGFDKSREDSVTQSAPRRICRDELAKGVWRPKGVRELIKEKEEEGSGKKTISLR